MTLIVYQYVNVIAICCRSNIDKPISLFRDDIDQSLSFTAGLYHIIWALDQSEIALQT